LFAPWSAKKAEKKKSTGLANKGYGVKGRKKPQKNPTHVRKAQKQGNEEEEENE